MNNIGFQDSARLMSADAMSEDEENEVSLRPKRQFSPRKK